MDNLHKEVINYLETLGFNIIDKSNNKLIADKAGFGGTRDTWQVWILPRADDDNIPQIENRLSREFDAGLKQYPNASRWLVTDSVGGFSQKFRNDAESKFNIKFRVPIQFFDTAFKADGLTKATTTTISELRQPVPRIPQPYSIAKNDIEERGNDILQHLQTAFRFINGASLRIIVGPAGVGKTWFFRNLFADLYSHFLTQKSKLESFPRPIPLSPEYLHGRGATLRTQDLVRQFIESEVETYIPQVSFEWMLTHGYALWLFDGLDELYAGDLRFFEILADLLTRPYSKAQILICARDSLLSSSPTFSDFLKDFPPGKSEEPRIELYRLARWDYSSKQAFADLHLSDDSKKTKFLTYISRSESLRTLSSLPYYCNLLVEEFKGGKTEDFADDFALLSNALTSIIEREKNKKGVFIPSNLQENGLDEWLETIASVCYATDFKGINKSDAEIYARLVLNSDLSEEESASTITSLVQFPLLARGTEVGVLTFEHELLAEYLVGRYLLKRLVKDPARSAQELGSRVDFADSLVGRYIASQLPKQPNGIESIVKSLKQDALPGRSFTVLLQLLLMAIPSRDIINYYGLFFEGRDLGEVQFVDRDLTGLSFRNCNLSNTVFENCNLQNALFEGAFLSGTKFAKLTEESLEEAQFGNIERFELVYIGQRGIDDREKFIEWVQKVTGKVEKISEPCVTTLQVRTLFLKFVRPDGVGRRSEMAEDILFRGKRFSGAPSIEECLEACIRFGYLQRVDWHDRVRRVPGDHYDDIVDFVKDWILSEHMREMLDAICPNKGCEHIPKNFSSILSKY